MERKISGVLLPPRSAGPDGYAKMNFRLPWVGSPRFRGGFVSPLYIGRFSTRAVPLTGRRGDCTSPQTYKGEGVCTTTNKEGPPLLHQPFAWTPCVMMFAMMFDNLWHVVLAATIGVLVLAGAAAFALRARAAAAASRRLSPLGVTACIFSLDEGSRARAAAGTRSPPRRAWCMPSL